MSGGLLIDGQIVIVPGVDVIGPHDAAWAHLNPGDGKPRTNRPTKVILHKTKADNPERIAPGAGPVGRAERTAEYWERKLADGSEEQHSGAHIVIDGHVCACLADLVRFEAYHGNQANASSIGIEHYEEQDATTFQLTYDNAVHVWRAIAETLGIQLQFHRPYGGVPLSRFANGGTDLVGFFGHRDVTSRRGRWDPGDHIFDLLEHELGAEAWDFERGQDRGVWRMRQIALNERGYRLQVDGVPGPATTAALKAEGYRGGVYALGRG